MKKDRKTNVLLEISQEPDLQETFGFQLWIEFEETFPFMSHPMDLEEVFENVIFFGKGPWFFLENLKKKTISTLWSKDIDLRMWKKMEKTNVFLEISQELDLQETFGFSYE